MSIDNLLNFHRLPNGFWVCTDGTGPYVRTGDLTFKLLGTQTTTVDGAGDLSTTMLTDDQLRANPVPVAIISPSPMTVTGGLTDTQLRANSVSVTVDNALAISGTVEVSNFLEGLTNTELRASPISVLVSDGDGPLTIDGVVAVSNLPATQPVSGTIAVSNLPTIQPVSGPLTDTQMRASAVPVMVSNLPATQPVSGTVAVSNFPATQPISGAIAVSNFPAVSSPPATVSTFNLTSAATTNATVVKASAGAMFGLIITNFATLVARSVKLYDKATLPTVGTDVPVLTLQVAINSSQIVTPGTLGMRFVNGIGLAITANPQDTDATVVSAKDVKVTLNYL